LFELPAGDWFCVQTACRHRTRQTAHHQRRRQTHDRGDESGNDTRCQVCGSLLYSVVRDGTFVHVAMGTLVDDPTVRPTKHIFVGSKARWFTISDDLPQYEEHAATAER
jgi:Uncharacterized conserved protein